jgi:chromosome segregation ATPase
VGNLQELVYKQGQAGVTRASVTITFNNTDKRASPVGYEHLDRISVNRQVRRSPPSTRTVWSESSAKPPIGPRSHCPCF